MPCFFLILLLDIYYVSPHFTTFPLTSISRVVSILSSISCIGRGEGGKRGKQAKRLLFIGYIERLKGLTHLDQSSAVTKIITDL